MHTETPSSAMLREQAIEAIVIGGSAGAMDVLRIVLGAMPRTVPIPILIAVHLPLRAGSIVHAGLQHTCPLPVEEAEDKAPLTGGHVYFAPPGYHLLVESDRCAALSIDEPVNYSRPSIDVLFESASEVYRDRLLGMLLSGASPDGAAGMSAIQQYSGLTIVQDPQTCEAQTMPTAALDAMRPDHVLAPAAIAAMVASLVPCNNAIERP